jgi:oxygen-independent coproporphyrinogen-3 oxidase
MDKHILNKYNRPGPRYTSYPPANFFTEEFNNTTYEKMLVRSNSKLPNAISLYVHIPFCPKLCYFCGCTTQIGARENQISDYIDALIKEIDMTAKLIDKSRNVTQIHWGGGTPNSIDMNYIRKVMDRFYHHFNILPDAEIAMECSPADLEFEHIDELKNMGFNRISMGIQDLRNDVLIAVNRSPSRHPVDKLIKHMRKLGFEGINLDLIYGLPLQTTESFKNTVSEIIKMKPDRIVTFSYAHVPWVKKGQKILERVGLPSPESKMDMLIESMDVLKKAGYETIGMDHYALPKDALAVALKTGKLHRNFQGYCTRETTGQVYGFGASSISQLQEAYSQNIKNTKQYIETIESGSFAIERGYVVSENEQIIRDVINEIMCNAFLDFNEISAKYNIDVQEVKDLVKFSKIKLKEFEDDDLLTFRDDNIYISELGRLIVRNIAMAFDPTLLATEGIYSKTV